jgi:hypothetical protein
VKTIEIIVSPTGEVNLQAHGYAGRECLAATRQLEAALGLKTGDHLTNDFYRLPAQAQQRQQERS